MNKDQPKPVIGLGEKVEPLRKSQPCPECNKPSMRSSYPFCSERCKNIDLNRWFKGSYAIPVSEEDFSNDEN